MRGLRRWPVDLPPRMASNADFDDFFNVSLNTRLNKQSSCRWFEMSWHSLWPHCNAFSLSWRVESVYQSVCTGRSPFMWNYVVFYTKNSRFVIVMDRKPFGIFLVCLCIFQWVEWKSKTKAPRWNPSAVKNISAISTHELQATVGIGSNLSGALWPWHFIFLMKGTGT